MAAIPEEDLVAAVRALDPGNRALLDLSLRWRVPDERIAAVLGSHPAEVALRRARVVDRLSSKLGVNGSGELVETALAALPAEAWTAPPRPPEAEPPLSARNGTPPSAAQVAGEASPRRPVEPLSVQYHQPFQQQSPLPPQHAWAPPPPHPPYARARVSGWQAALGAALAAGLGAAVGIALTRRRRRR